MSKHYDFKQAIRVGRSTFPLGIRQVPAEIEAHPHFKQFLKDGAVKVAGASQVEKKFEDLPTLPPPASEAAKRSQVAAAAVERGQAEASDVAPEAEIGGDADAVSEDEAVDESADEADESDSKKGKGRKGKGR